MVYIILFSLSGMRSTSESTYYLINVVIAYFFFGRKRRFLLIEETSSLLSLQTSKYLCATFFIHSTACLIDGSVLNTNIGPVYFFWCRQENPAVYD